MAMNRDPHDPNYDPYYDSEHTPHCSFILANIIAAAKVVYVLLCVIALALFTALLFSPNTNAQDIPLARQIGRVVVTHCRMENPPPPVVIIHHPEILTNASGGVATDPQTLFAEVEVDAEPPSPEVGCRTLDSHVHPSQISGTLMTWTIDGH